MTRRSLFAAAVALFVAKPVQAQTYVPEWYPIEHVAITPEMVWYWNRWMFSADPMLLWYLRQSGPARGTETGYHGQLGHYGFGFERGRGLWVGNEHGRQWQER